MVPLAGPLCDSIYHDTSTFSPSLSERTRKGKPNSKGIQPKWMPIRPVTTQYAVGRTKSTQVVRKQFPLHPATAKTVHRSQGDSQTQIVVIFTPVVVKQSYKLPCVLSSCISSTNCRENSTAILFSQRSVSYNPSIVITLFNAT